MHTNLRYLHLYYYHWVDTSGGGLLVPEVIVRHVVSVLVQKWFIRYLRLYYNHWVDTSTGGQIVPEGIVRPVFSVSVLT